MYKIAIVEDETIPAEQLKFALEKYALENGHKFCVDLFREGLSFLEEYRYGYDIIFLDIQLPGIDGMQIARQLRRVDDHVCICFVTNMTQYAINGYEVNARDFIAKPIQYFDFAIRIKRLLAACDGMREETLHTIQSKMGMQRINVRDIIYIEVCNHSLVYHTKDGIYEVRGSMNTVQERLADTGRFGRCHTSYLVNFEYIRSFNNNTLDVGVAILPVSRTKRENFVREMNRYITTI